MAEYIESICRSCFHSYVCEQFNRHRDSHNEKCHFYNDHFAPAADVEEVQKELRKVVTRLHNEYERAKKLSFVRNPLAYALYRVWKYVDGGDNDATY